MCVFKGCVKVTGPSHPFPAKVISGNHISIASKMTQYGKTQSQRSGAARGMCLELI